MQVGRLGGRQGLHNSEARSLLHARKHTSHGHTLVGSLCVKTLAGVTRHRPSEAIGRQNTGRQGKEVTFMEGGGTGAQRKEDGVRSLRDAHIVKHA